jgi:hypothetical protein
VVHENPNLRAVGFGLLHLCSSLEASAFAEKAGAPDEEGLTNSGTAAAKFTVSQFAIIEF